MSLRSQSESSSTFKPTSNYRNSNLPLFKIIAEKYPEINLDNLGLQISNDHHNKDCYYDKLRQSKYDNVDACRHSDTTEFSEPWSAWEPWYQMADTCFNKQQEKVQKTATITRNRNRENKGILCK